MGRWHMHLLISHLILQSLELTLMLAPQLSRLQAELTAELLLLLPLALPPTLENLVIYSVQVVICSTRLVICMHLGH